MNKLTKAQEERFDEKFINHGIDFPDGLAKMLEIRQHLAEELATQKKEIIEKLEKLDGFGVDMGYDIGVHQVIGKDQAIKEIE